MSQKTHSGPNPIAHTSIVSALAINTIGNLVLQKNRSKPGHLERITIDFEHCYTNTGIYTIKKEIRSK